MPPDEPPLRDRISQLGVPPKPSPLGRLVMGVQVPPKVPADAVPRIAHDAVTPLPKALARARAATQAGMPAPPPGGLPVASLPPPLPARAPAPPAAPEPPRSITPTSGRDLVANPYDPPTMTRRARAELERHGDRLHEPPPPSTSDPPPATRRAEPPWWRTAKGVAIAVPVIVAGVSGVLGGITAGVVVPIIKAAREPYDGARAKDIADARKAGEECQAAVASERKSTLAREEALATRVNEAEKKTSEVARSVPVVKPDPNRPPK